MRLILTIFFVTTISFANASSIDPYEQYNRKVYNFNQTLDDNILRPIALWYSKYIPNPIQKSVNNFFSNLGDFASLGNHILQADKDKSMKTLMRLSINSTFGILGFVDIASYLGLDQNKNNFGNTLKAYGWKNSAYLVIPILGPSTVRDTIGLVPDFYFNPIWAVADGITPSYENRVYFSLSLFAISGINTRVKFLDADKLLDSAIDPYIAMRDFYLQSNTTTQDDSIDIDKLINEKS